MGIVGRKGFVIREREKNSKSKIGILRLRVGAGNHIRDTSGQSVWAGIVRAHPSLQC